MVVTFDLVDQKLIHPEQAIVEVYNCITPTVKWNDILELEHHSVFKTLELTIGVAKLCLLGRRGRS